LNKLLQPIVVGADALRSCAFFVWSENGIPGGDSPVRRGVHMTIWNYYGLILILLLMHVMIN